MKLDNGTIVLLLAAAAFYIRLVWIQREHARPNWKPAGSSRKKKGQNSKTSPINRYWILSPYPRDLIIAGLGVLAMIFGILLKTEVLQLPQMAEYWWLPLSFGILAFSFGFR